MLKSLRSHYIVLLLFVVSIGLYYGSLIEIFYRPNAISLDDNDLMLHLLNHRLTLKDIFVPDGFGKYYRPFLSLSFFIDQRLYGDVTFGFRLTNILIHALNVILIYILGRMLFRNAARKEEIAFFSALLFAVHPAAVESVSWISGRTDSLAVFWSLSTIIFYLAGRGSKRWYFLPVALFCMVAAVLSKEVAVVIPVLMVIWEFFYHHSFGFKKTKYAPLASALFIALVPLYLHLRSSGLAAGDMGIELIKSGFMDQGVLSSGIFFLASIGFYLKKTIIPLPLNIAITNINIALYALVGLLSLLAVAGLVFLKNFRRHHFFLVWSLLGMLPAALISFTTMAWTPWAERYLYFSLVPLSIFIVICFFGSLEQQRGRFKKVVPVIGLSILLLFSISTVHRSFLWNDDLRLWKDAYSKSPDFIYAAVGYATVLAKRGETNEAEKILNEARTFHGAKHTLYLNLGHIYRKKGFPEKAKGHYLEALREARADKRLVLTGPQLKKSILVSLADVELANARLPGSLIAKDKYYSKGVENLIEAYHEDPSDTFLLYRIAKLYLLIRSDGEARKYFEEFMKVVKDDNNVYKQMARKMSLGL